ncbi:UvrD-helicase domain-containing protein [Brevibacterium sp. CSND-B09]|uniref:UvrD-helicase domain-containing protein n=1 Tax=Brevibacterium sp. CSND-B09 TaxID=3462571 RepID=UPI00406A3AF5
MAEWKPGWFARLFKGAGSWQLSLDGGRLRVDGIAQPFSADVINVRRLDTDKSTKTVGIALASGENTVLTGLTRNAVREVRIAFDFQLQERQNALKLLSIASAHGADAAKWWTQVRVLLEGQRWADQDSVSALEKIRPDVSAWTEAEKNPVLVDELFKKPKAEWSAVTACRTMRLAEHVRQRNEDFLKWESRELAEYFNTVEKSPLTPEQIRASVCFDNRVRVIASAGSGKTSTMVGRAGYAIHRGIAQPAEVLALAFNNKAAAELSDRFKDRLGDDGAAVASSTFHAFGLRVIGEATGRKPSTPDDLVHDNGIGRMSKTVDGLRDSDPRFRRDWDLFRLVLGRPLADFGEDVDIERSDRTTGKSGFGTLDGKVVKSQEEVMIANWLFINGVNYEYERPYSQDVADAGHRQYEPDFYYPDIDTWHEHWALGADGNPAPQFEGYAESMDWRRQTHTRFGTRLIETTSASIRDGSGFDHLEAELRRLGVELEENPYREAPGEEPISDRKMVELVRSFLVHVKGNKLSLEQLKRRAGNGIRERLFLKLFDTIAVEWDRRLKSEGKIDFEDMLNLATDHIEAGRWQSPYRLVMVDEMQDTSASRAALVRSLLKSSGTYLYAVGDDWQSINRFAGSDLGVMTRFDDWFGQSTTIWLSRTFRSPQSLCDVAGDFVTKNPAQIVKQVSSSADDADESILAVSVRDRDQYDPTLRQYLYSLDADCDRRTSVLVLGRYNYLRDNAEGSLNGNYSNLEIEFSTVHAAKGKEADYIVVLGLERFGFPSAIEDDPLLQLAVVARDPYPFAEDRRLFYVALTRARRSALLMTVSGRESPFLLELVSSNQVAVRNVDGESISPVICPKCNKRTMTLRTGKFGDFYGCTGFPLCKGTKKAV